MGYLSGALAFLLACALLAAGFYRDDAGHWKNEYQTLETSYKTAALAAQTHAQAVEAADLKNLQAQSSQAIQQAQDQALQARNQLTEYQKKLAAAASVKDDGHRCAGVEIPGDLIP
jgi:uncharacterized protein HemX